MAQKIDLGALFGAQEVETFLGLPRCKDLSQLEAKIAILGAPGATPYASVGPYCRNAPKTLRQAAAGLAANIERMNFDLGGPLFPKSDIHAADCGDVAYDDVDFAQNRAGIRNAVRSILDADAVPVLLGGDDSVPIPMLQAFEGRGPVNILQIDAHIDWRPDHMGEDMGLSSTMRRASEMEHIGQIVQVGARGIGSAAVSDYKDAVAAGVTFVTAEEVHANGTDRALADLPDGDLIICLDVDALDPSIVPAVISRSPGGLSYFQTLELIRGAAHKGRIRAINFVEFLPEADIEGLGAAHVSRLITSSLGVIARQY